MASCKIVIIPVADDDDAEQLANNVSAADRRVSDCLLTPMDIDEALAFLWQFTKGKPKNHCAEGPREILHKIGQRVDPKNSTDKRSTQA